MKLAIPEEPFDHVYLISLLGDYVNANDKIRRMVKSGEILKLKKGLYVSADSSTHRFTVANLLYSPSYVSLESALSYWGMIPEKVVNITSVTNKRTREYTNKLGQFYYNPIKSSSLHLGIVYDAANRFVIANQTKAVSDYLKVKKIKYKDVIALLENDLRIDIEAIAALDLELLSLLGEEYKSPSIRKLSKQVRKL